MLAVGRGKVMDHGQVACAICNGKASFPDDTFDCVTIAFLRNFTHRMRLAEFSACGGALCAQFSKVCAPKLRRHSFNVPAGGRLGKDA
jgi:ubiquinone/menaquinone biosynthesis C-methylase UbiE